MVRDMKILIVTWLLVTLFEVNAETTSPLSTRYKWKYFDYLWESQAQKEFYVTKGLYNPRALVPIDVDQSRDNRMFVTIIKAAGVPATLNTVSTFRHDSQFLLKPYPNWSWYENRNPCDGILNVYRVAIDDCNRLWVLDTGRVSLEYVCPAKLLTFDLATDNLISQQILDDKIAINSYTGRGLLVTPIVETQGPRCEDTTVYIADTQGNALIVLRNSQQVRLVNDSIFGPQPRYNRYTIAGESFNLDDGILGMALSPKIGYHGHRFLAFRPMSSVSLYVIETNSLKKSIYGGAISFFQANDELTSQAAAQVFSSDGTLFYGLTTEIAIGCWNINYPSKFKIATTDNNRLQFASGMKVIRYSNNPKDEYLLVMTNRLQKIYNNSTSIDEFNFHILEAPVHELIKSGGCNKDY